MTQFASLAEKRRFEKAAANKADKRIDAIFRARCANVPVNILDIGKIFAKGRKAIAEGATEEQLAERVVAFVETVRVKS